MSEDGRGARRVSPPTLPLVPVFSVIGLIALAGGMGILGWRKPS